MSTDIRYNRFIWKPGDIQIVKKPIKKMDSRQILYLAIYRTAPDPLMPGFNMTAYIVDGQYVRDNIYLDFTEGGNDQRYGMNNLPPLDFVPLSEFWIDDANQSEAEYILIHESVERRLMAGGMSYDTAHSAANLTEQDARDHPETVIDILEKEGWYGKEAQAFE